MKWMKILASAMLLAGCAESYVNATPEQGKKVLMDAAHPEMAKRSPDTYQARFETNKGVFVIEVDRKLSPNGSDRFYNLVRHGYYDGNKFFRVLPGFIVQWGIHADPKVNAVWSETKIPDDEVKVTNSRGTITFAKPGSPDSRSTHLFVNYKDNGHLDSMGFSPFGTVVEGMPVLDNVNAQYGQEPNQGMIAQGGNAYLNEFYPGLDTILSARIVEPAEDKDE